MTVTDLEMPARLSHSQLTSYMNCGEQYRLTRRRKLPDSYSWALAGGSAFHSWTEIVDQGIPLEPDQFKTLLDEQVKEAIARPNSALFTEDDIKPTGRASKEWPNKRDRAWWEHHGPIFCQQYLDWREAPDNDVMPLGATVEIEMKVEGTLGEINTLGFIDRLILDGPQGEPVVLDLKTGKEPGTALQLATYAVLASEQLGIEITKGAFYLAEKGEMSKIIDLSKFTREYIEGLYDQARRGIGAGVYLPNPNAFCSTCTVKQYCGLYGGKPPEGVPVVESPIQTISEETE